MPGDEHFISEPDALELEQEQEGNMLRDLTTTKEFHQA